MVSITFLREGLRPILPTSPAAGNTRVSIRSRA
jgi:hypothetical protein